MQVAIETTKLILSTAGGIIAALLCHDMGEKWFQDFLSTSPLAPTKEALGTWPVYFLIGCFSTLTGPLIVPPIGMSPSSLAMLGVVVTGILRLFCIVRRSSAIARPVVVWIPCFGMWALLYSVFRPTEMNRLLLERIGDAEFPVISLFLWLGSLVILYFVEQLGKMRQRPINPK